jgi:hypothetical protein
MFCSFLGGGPVNLDFPNDFCGAVKFVCMCVTKYRGR